MAAPARQASGPSNSPVPGTRTIELVIGSTTPFLCASVTAMRSASTGGSGSMANSLTLPFASEIRMVSDFFDVDGGDIARRHQRAIDDAPLRGARAVAAGKRLQQPRGRALRGSGIEIVADLDGPGAAADRDAGQRGLVMRLELALRRDR